MGGLWSGGIAQDIDACSEKLVRKSVATNEARALTSRTVRVTVQGDSCCHKLATTDLNTPSAGEK